MIPIKDDFPETVDCTLEMRQRGWAHFAEIDPMTCPAFETAAKLNPSLDLPSLHTTSHIA